MQSEVRLEAEGRPGTAGSRFERGAMVRQHVLVGGDYSLAGTKRRSHERVSGLVAAHQLDDDIDAVVRHEMSRGIGQ